MNLIQGILFTLLSFAMALSKADVQLEMARKAYKVFSANCYECHGKPGQRVRGDFGFILNFKALRDSDLVDLNRPERSQIFELINSGEMPYKRPKLKDQDIQTVLAWLKAGAPDYETNPNLKTSTDEDTLNKISVDMATLAIAKKRTTRYLVFPNYTRTKESAKLIATLQEAVNKLSNSLSFANQITLVQRLGDAPVFRLDIQDYGWTTSAWDAMANAEPFGWGKEFTLSYSSLQSQLQSNTPIVRADWFIFALSRPPLYYQFLNLGGNESFLLNTLGLAPDSLRNPQTVRAGFHGGNFPDGSQVSVNNRMIERQPTKFGYYWKSYDFRSESGLANIFLNPIGPGAGAAQFQHAGGEIIFSLPNGLQAYYLENNLGVRLDEAPTDIVKDSTRFDGKIINGISCMSCHVAGMREHSDQIRAFVDINKNLFSLDTVNKVQKLFIPKGSMDQVFANDSARFTAALSKMNQRPAVGQEPVRQITDHFEGIVSFEIAAAELDVNPSELEIATNPDVVAFVREIKLFGYTRERFNSVYKRLKSEFLGVASLP